MQGDCRIFSNAEGYNHLRRTGIIYYHRATWRKISWMEFRVYGKYTTYSWDIHGIKLVIIPYSHILTVFRLFFTIIFLNMWLISFRSDSIHYVNESLGSHCVTCWLWIANVSHSNQDAPLTNAYQSHNFRNKKIYFSLSTNKLHRI